ncbi:hypothetical protein CVO77_03635 [Sphingopyxis lindanitolerans]|uniref:Uncharacterized protein n=1 Tax=Sphingopyxis lindanitolerans TaxID=2054227 RepID=A0A2S8B5Q7_9SPHN|nr:hypothetical protein [Sphingopyxis lindanitolerans]PQM27673.1 hypothetical protein CVO77_03635 [Sphingopyxis lindanitolerans]
MILKEWVRIIASMKIAEIREVTVLLSGMKGADERDAAEEVRLQEYINSLPGRPDNGNAEMLRQARHRAGRCCNCGKAKIETEEQVK